jgi:TP901 family phage tail tape measure protein
MSQRRSILNAQLNLLPPTNVRQTVQAINRQLRGVRVQFDLTDFQRRIRQLQQRHLRNMRVTFDLNHVRTQLRSLRNQRIAFTVDRAAILRSLNAAVRRSGIRVNFNVTGIRGEITQALQRPFRIRFDISSLYRQLNLLQTRGVILRVNTRIGNTTTNITRSLRQTSQAARTATDDMEHFGEQAGLAIRRYGAFTLATTGFFKLAGAISAGVDEAIKFDRELVRLSQVTGLALSGLQPLSDEVTRLSKTFGTSSSEILNVAVTLAQAGLSAKDTKVALEALAKTTVSASFGDIKDTTEAAIAIMQQFNQEASNFENILGSVNAVAAKYAVEAEDITVAVRRAGGAFQAAGGNLDEFQALFTSVRQTTRESAETIAVGLRTIFSRLQRVRTQNFLEALGIDVLNDENQFIGPFKAIQKIGVALQQVKSTDPRFAQIVEELGGFRQVSKVIPLLTQLKVQNEALNVSLRGGSSLAEDAAVAQQSLAVQLGKIREEFLALIRTFANNQAFRGTVDVILEMTRSLIKLGDTLADIAPFLLILGGTKLASDFAPFFRGFNKKIPLLGGGPQNATPTTRSVVAARRAGTNEQFNPTIAGIGGIGGLLAIDALSRSFLGANEAVSTFTSVLARGALTVAAIGSLSGGLTNLVGGDKVNGVRDQLLRPFGVRNNVETYRDTFRSAELFNSTQQYGPFPQGAMSPYLDPDAEARRAVDRNVRRRTLLTAGSAVAGGAAIIGGQFVSSAASENIRGGGTSRFQSGLGGALSAGGTGALLGSSLGPIGAAIGGVTGGLIGLVSALKAATQEIINVRVGKSIESLSGRLESFSKGRAQLSSIRGSVVDSVNNLGPQLIGATGDTRQNLLGSFNQEAAKLDDFFRAVAKETKTFAEFEKQTDGALKTFSLFTKIPYQELEKQIKDQIETQNKSLKLAIQLNKVQTEEVRNATEINALREAIANVSLETDRFSANMRVLSDLGSGSGGAGLVGDISGRVNAASEGRISNDSQLRRVAASTLGLFGSATDNQSATFVSASKALRELPDILLRVRNQDPFGGESSNFEDRFAAEVEKFGPEVARSLVQGVRSLIGSEAKDERILSSISDNVFNAANEIGNSLRATFDVLKDFGPALAQQKEKISEAFNTLAEKTLEAAEFQDKINQTQNEQRLFGRQFTKEKTRFDEITKDYLDGIQKAVGTSDPTRLGARARTASSRIRDIQSRLSSEFTTPQQQVELNKELVQQRVEYERTRNALRQLSESTHVLSEIQEELARAEKKRGFKTNILDTLSFGSNEEIMRLFKDANNALNVSRAGIGATDGLQSDDKKSLLDFLKAAGDAGISIGGNDADKVLDSVRIQQAIRAGLSQADAIKVVVPGESDEEKKAQVAAQEIFAKQLTALDELRKQSLLIGVTAARDISAQNKTFLDQLFAIFKEEAKRPLDAQRRQLINEAGTLNGRKGLIGNLAGNLGVAPGDVNIGSLTGTFGVLKEIAESTKGKEGVLGKFNNPEVNGLLNFKGLSDEDINKRIGKIGGITGADLTKFLEKTPEDLFGFASVDDRIRGNKRSRADQIKELERAVRGTLGSAQNSQLIPFQNRIDKGSADLRNLGPVGNALNSKLQGRSSSDIQQFLDRNNKLVEQIGSLPIEQTNKQLAELAIKIQQLTTEIANIDAKKLPAPITRNRGGIIPGSGNKDTVPAMLTPGEFVLNKDAVNSMGEDTLNEFNAGGSVWDRKRASRARVIERMQAARAKQVANLQKARAKRVAGFSKVFGHSRGMILGPPSKGPSNVDQVLQQGRAVQEANQKSFDERYRLNLQKQQESVFGPPPTADQRLQNAQNAYKRSLEERSRINEEESKRRSESKSNHNSMAAESRERYERRKREDAERLARQREEYERSGKRRDGSSVNRAEFYRQEEERRRIENEKYLRKNAGVPIRRAGGGIIPGSGSGDTVPALLTPGEFVVRKSAVNRIGASNLAAMNSGGIGGAPTLNVDQFRSVVQEFSMVTNKLATAMNNFPKELTMTINGRQEIIINGADVFSKIMPEVNKVIGEKLKDGINNMLTEKFPTVGRMT